MVIFNGKLGYKVQFELVDKVARGFPYQEIIAVTIWAKDGTEVGRKVVLRGKDLNEKFNQIRALKSNPTITDSEERRLQMAWAALNGSIPGHRVQ